MKEILISGLDLIESIVLHLNGPDEEINKLIKLIKESGLKAKE